MTSVTQRIKKKGMQPRGGYVNPRRMLSANIPAVRPLHDRSEESINSSLMGIAVDCLVRFSLESDVEKAFATPLRGASRLGLRSLAKSLTSKVRGLDETSIKAACQLAGFDCAGHGDPATYKPVDGIVPNQKTIENVRTLVERTLAFFKNEGPVVDCGVTFEGGYTTMVGDGEADYLTEEAIWDLKVSINPPTKEHTLQLCCYLLLGKSSIKTEEFSQVARLGVVNPRLGQAFWFDVASVPSNTFDEIDKKVLGRSENDDTIEQHVRRWCEKSDSSIERTLFCSMKEKEQLLKATLKDVPWYWVEGDMTFPNATKAAAHFYLKSAEKFLSSLTADSRLFGRFLIVPVIRDENPARRYKLLLEEHIECVETGECWPNVEVAAEAVGVDEATMRHVVDDDALLDFKSYIVRSGLPECIVHPFKGMDRSWIERPCMVICVETGKRFKSVEAAADSVGGKPSWIERSIKSNNRYKGYHWAKFD